MDKTFAESLAETLDRFDDLPESKKQDYYRARAKYSLCTACRRQVLNPCGDVRHPTCDLNLR